MEIIELQQRHFKGDNLVMESKKVRDTYIDIAKGIGMLLVIYGHLAERSDFLRIIIYSFHMPLFFIISGYYFNAQADFRAVLKKGLKQIVAPAYLFLVLDFLLINHNDDLTLKNIVNSLIFRGGMVEFTNLVYTCPVSM